MQYNRNQTQLNEHEKPKKAQAKVVSDAQNQANARDQNEGVQAQNAYEEQLRSGSARVNAARAEQAGHTYNGPASDNTALGLKEQKKGKKVR